jgi:hypothetical protein
MQQLKTLDEIPNWIAVEVRPERESTAWMCAYYMIFKVDRDYTYLVCV